MHFIGKDCKDCIASGEINARTKRLGVTFLFSLKIKVLCVGALKSLWIEPQSVTGYEVEVQS